MRGLHILTDGNPIDTTRIGFQEEVQTRMKGDGEVNDGCGWVPIEPKTAVEKKGFEFKIDSNRAVYKPLQNSVSMQRFSKANNNKYVVSETFQNQTCNNHFVLISELP